MFPDSINPILTFQPSCYSQTSYSSWTVAHAVSCCLSTHIIQNECLAYITIQTLLLWKALSFLLCAGKHHWEHEQNTSKQDTNSCCCCWLHGWMLLSICRWFRGKEWRQNSTNYGIHHTKPSDWSLLCQVLNLFTRPLHAWLCFILSL